MSINKAISRLYWRFGGNGNTKPFPVNQQDLDSFNEIKNYVKDTQKEIFYNNVLFSKLFVYLYGKVMMNDRSSLFETNARKKIANVLKKPLSQLIEEMTEELNHSGMYGKLEASGLNMKPPYKLTDADRLGNTKTIQNLLKSDYKELVEDVFDYETVEQIMISEVNFMINEFNK